MTITCGVYKIISPTNRIYIGQSINIERRFKEYYKMKWSTKRQVKLYRSFEKHGVENHIFEIIEECIIDNINERERFWQDHYDVLNGGLNCMLTCTDSKKQIISEETRMKMSAWQIGDGNHRAFKGRKHSPETIEFLRTVNKGKFPSVETREKLSVAKKGKPFTEEHIKNMNIARKTSSRVYEGKKVINIETGEIFITIMDAAKSINKKYAYLQSRLIGLVKNNTSFRHYEEHNI